MPWLRSLLALGLFVLAAPAADWPQWLGPNRDGHSAENVAPWKEAPKKLWSVPVGDGHSSPIVAGDKVYLHAWVKGKEAEEVLAFDAVKGTKVWSATYDRAAFNNPFGNGPRATPCVADGKLYTYGVTGVLSRFDAAKGTKEWQVDTLKKYNAPNLTFGVSCSPIVDGDKVIVAVGKGASVVAFETRSGEAAWKSLEDPAAYSSPVIFGKGKDRQLSLLTQQGVVSLNPDDGSLFWKFPLVDLLNESSTTPVKVGDILLASSVTYGGVGLKLGEKEGKPSVEQQWKNAVLSCYFSTPVAVDAEHVYMVTGAIVPPSATLRCVEVKTGKELWKREKVGKYHASLLRTGNGLLLLLDDAGNLMLLEPNKTEYRERSRSKLCGLTWAHPALANGRLYVRDDKELMCFQLRE